MHAKMSAKYVAYAGNKYSEALIELSVKSEVRTYGRGRLAPRISMGQSLLLERVLYLMAVPILYHKVQNIL